MDDRDSIALYGSEVSALIPLLRGHFTTLASLWETPSSGDFMRAESECRRLLQAATDLSAAYHATDCAMIGAALLHLVVDTEKRMRVAMSIPAIAGSLDYLAARAKAFTRFRRLLAPTPAEDETRKRLIAMLSGADLSSASLIASRDEGAGGTSTDFDTPEGAESEPGIVTGAVTYYESFEPPPAAPIQPLRRTDDDDDIEAMGVERSSLDVQDWDAIRAFQSSRLMPAQRSFPTFAPPMDLPAPDSALAGLDDIPPELRDFFRREAADDLHNLRLLVARIEQNPTDGEAVAEMRRGVHKLKGSAAQFGFTSLAQAALELEDMVRVLEGRQVLPSATVLRDMDDLLDVMDDARAADGDAGAAASINSMPSLSHSDERSIAPITTSSLIGTTVETGALRVPPQAGSERMLRLALREVDELTAHVQALVFARAGLAATQADALTVQSDLQRIVDRLRRVGAELGDLEPSTAPHPITELPWRAHEAEQGPPASSHANLGPPSSMSARAEPSAWEVARHRELSQTANALHEIAADLAAESASLRATLERLAQASDGQAGASEDLQRAVMRMRLVPLGDLLPHLTFEVTRVQRTAGKRVTLTMTGEDIQIDRNVCDALREPLTQLLRNAVLHGIESPEERLAVEKPERGEIWISATCSGSDLVLEVGDDGRGVSSQGLVAAAVAAGVLDPHEPEELSASRTLALMFEPAVTTASEARLLGGRGIGLDEVRTAIERLGGTVSARTQPGRGSIFRIQTPISLTTMRALHVQVSRAVYAVPFGVVARTVLFPLVEGADDEFAGRSLPRVARVSFAHGGFADAEGWESDGEELPIFSFDELLGFDESLGAKRYVLVIDSGRGRAAVLVDELVDEREVLVQSLPRHLQRHALRGTTITPRGELALIVDVASLVEHALSTYDDRPREIGAPGESPRVLVVDDSEAVRRAIEMILRRGGFNVDLAADGQEAWEYIEARPPQVVLLDVEMPRMGGIELLAELSGRWPSDMRVIMLTSRGSQEHMERATQLGASAYLIKPCPQELLLQTVHSVLAPAVMPS